MVLLFLPAVLLFFFLFKVIFHICYLQLLSIKKVFLLWFYICMLSGRQLSMQNIKCVNGSIKIDDLGHDSVCVTILHTSMQTIDD